MHKDPDDETADRQQRKRKEERRKINTKEANMKCVYFTRVLESNEKDMANLSVHFKKLLERQI